MPGSSHRRWQRWVFSGGHCHGRSLRAPVLPEYRLPPVPPPHGGHTETELVRSAPRTEIERCLRQDWHRRPALTRDLPSLAKSGRSAPETTLYPELPLVRSLRTSFRVPEFSETRRIDLLRSIERPDTLPVEINLFAAMYRRASGFHKFANGGSDFRRVIRYQLVDDSHRDTLFTAIDRPDECAIRGIKFLDSRLLLNHLGAIQSQPCF